MHTRAHDELQWRWTQHTSPASTVELLHQAYMVRQVRQVRTVLAPFTRRVLGEGVQRTLGGSVDRSGLGASRATRDRRHLQQSGAAPVATAVAAHIVYMLDLATSLPASRNIKTKCTFAYYLGDCLINTRLPWTSLRSRRSRLSRPCLLVQQPSEDTPVV